jgi:hypothetical protein
MRDICRQGQGWAVSSGVCIKPVPLTFELIFKRSGSLCVRASEEHGLGIEVNVT